MKEAFNEEERESLRHRFDAYMRACINSIARDEVEKEVRYRDLFLVDSEIAESELSSYEDKGLLSAEDDSFSVKGEEVRVRDEKLAVVLREMRRLRKDIILLTLAGLSDREICEILDILPDTVRVERSKGRKDIRKSYEKA